MSIIRTARRGWLWVALALNIASPATLHDAMGANPTAPAAGNPMTPHRYLRYDGINTYVEIDTSPDLSVGDTGLTIEAWMRPDALVFSHTEGSRANEQYVHWLGKGKRGEQEWSFRMYSATTPPGPRANRISFYVFDAQGGRGCGSYFQDPLQPKQWLHVVGVVDTSAQTTAIYKNGVLRHVDSFAGLLTTAAGSAPLRLGTRDFASFFLGGIGPVRVWKRALNAEEVQGLFLTGTIPRNDLVAEYLFEEGRGSTAADSADSHDGSIFGARHDSRRGPLGTATGASGGGC